MPTILIDVTRLLYRRLCGHLPTGVDRVSLAYLRHYADRAQATIIYGRWHLILSRPHSQQLFTRLLEIEPRRLADGWLALRLCTSAVWRTRKPKNLSRAILFNTGHMGLRHPHYAQTLRQAGARLVLMVHDLIPLTHPEYCRPNAAQAHTLRMNHALTMSRGIITNSRDTLHTFINFAQTMGQPMPPAVVAPLATGLHDWEIGSRPIVKPYFVVLSTIEARKNHLLLLQVWRELVAQMGAQTPHLVIIGHRGWECENVVDMLERCQQLQGIVTEHSRCSDKMLVNYLGHAQALLFPSFAEGYGMPVVEALSHGVPVMASDLAVFREFAGDIPEYVNPIDGKAWMTLIQDYSQAPSPLREAQLARLRHFVAPTWHTHFSIVDDFLQQLDCSPAVSG